MQEDSEFPKSISHYRMLDKLGAGGMGEVYLAEDTRLGRRVALKFLPASYQYDPSRRDRFLREARAASALRSANIAAIFDIGEHEGSRFIVMEYVEGEVLSDKVRRGPMAVAEAVGVAIQVADALDEAHSVGIIHRDIKSANLILTDRGLVKVLDFGLAKIIEQPGDQQPDKDRTLVFGKETMPGLILGTASYMSPEQARGLEVDGRTDIFSLGVVIYEMLTGQRPFEGATTSDLIVSILEREPIPLARHSAEIPAQLQWIVTKALRKAREDRYQTVRELLIDLKSLKQDMELEARLGPTVSLDSTSGISQGKTAWHRTPEPTKDQAPEPAVASGVRRRRPRKAIDSLAVMPMANASADPSTEYLTDGITESIINSLSQLPRLRVMARSTVFRYKGSDIDPIEVGRRLGVRAVLMGRVQHIGDNLVVGTELVDTYDGSQLWGENYNRKLSDIFAVQEEISKEISEKLKLRLSGEQKKRLAKRHTDNAEAYQLYLKGRYYWNKWTEEGFTKAVEYFNEAIDKDPNYALAYAGLSDAYGVLWYFNYLPPDPTVQRSKAAALKALELDDALAEPHTSLADIKVYYDWDWAGAEKEFKRAIELNPGYATGHQLYGMFLLAMGRREESIKEITLAQELDPLSLIINSSVGMSLWYAGRYDEAIDKYKKVLDMDQNFPQAHGGLGLCYEQKGMFDEAVEEYLKSNWHYATTPEAAAELRQDYAAEGMKGYWRVTLRLMHEKAERSYVSPYLLAQVYAWLGENDQSFEWLEKAYNERAGLLVHLKGDPRFEGLRADPRFTDLMKRIGLTA